MRVCESEDVGPKHTQRERERENIIEVHHKLGIDSVSDVPKTDREDGLILPILRQNQRKDLLVRSA